jgi:hypothetical protein
MSPHVNLLLLLSALLSALTGVGSSVRAQDRAQAVAEGSVAVARAAVTPRRTTSRPIERFVTLPQVARIESDTMFALVPGEPPFATRRRE